MLCSVGFQAASLHLLIAGVFACSGLEISAQSIEISAEGQQRKSAHEFLFGPFAEGKKLTLKGDGPEQVLDEIVISTERVEVGGEMLITLPPGSERVASMFRYLILRGENLDHLGELELLPGIGAELHRSTQEPSLYRVQIGSLPIPTDDAAPLQIKSKGSATITEIAFNSQGRLSSTFDDIPYRTLGAEYPRETVDVKIDLKHELSVGGHVDLEREKFCRYYAVPGMVHESFERWAAERNFSPGRQILKLQPALVRGYSPRQPLLKEDPNKTGAADLSFFQDHPVGSSLTNAIPEFRSIKFAMCFDEWPDFMSIKHVGRGTPLIEHFSDAAELVGEYVAAQIRDSGRTATYWEVKNESTIKAEWDYHWLKDIDAWGLLAEFHNKVAAAIHAKSPEVLVGGPSSAWMQVQVKNFSMHRDHVRFMDETRDHLDFYSHHFYEDIGTVGAWERRKGRYTNYLLGRLEAILNMIQAHMQSTDNVKPILITEFGSLQAGRGPSDYWLRLRSYSAFMHKLMQRPHEIDLAVPFAFLNVPWNPFSGDAAFIPKPGQPPNGPLDEFEATPVKYFFELWRDFDGRRLPVSFQREWLDVTAVHDGNRIQIALTNMGGQRLDVNVTGLIGKIPFVSVRQRRLFYEGGAVRFEDEIRHKDLNTIPVDVEETTIISIELESPLTIVSMIEQEFHYAEGTAVRSTDYVKTGFKISLPALTNISTEKPYSSANLIVGVQRDGGLGGAFRGSFNGKPFKLNAVWAQDMNHLFAPLTIKLPVDLLSSDNVLTVEPREGLTITSVQLVTNR